MVNENGYGLNVNTGVDADQDEAFSQSLKRRHGKSHGQLRRTKFRFDKAIGRPLLFGTAEELQEVIGERRVRRIWR